jgi:type IV pilus assembly protein PilE
MQLRRTEKLSLRRENQGITLLELMAVVVVIGVLGVIAIPSYRQYSMRAQRTEAKTALLQLAANQERFYIQNNTYTNNLPALGFAAGTSEKGVYTLAVPLANANTYQAVATPTPGGGINGVDMNADADCALFSINAQGVRAAAPDPTTTCW